VPEKEEEHSCVASNNYRKHIRVIFVTNHDNMSLPFIAWNRDTDVFLGPRLSCYLT